MSRSRRLRDLSGTPAFEQLTAELARAAVAAKGGKSLRRQAVEQAQRPVGAEPDNDAAAARPGSGSGSG
ncbi:hypothetical protein GCM10011579_080650 [Streptomyces albiflavescens]|uniref:Uncharacterized protein n=1 Tax=Streptomyces albiflavescens TaxID=1623582 RepID=A0A917YD24_9ACTN|nr:hypothetical protein GCM10011579_080650 [Streptomyces albiflavescens]